MMRLKRTRKKLGCSPLLQSLTVIVVLLMFVKVSDAMSVEERLRLRDEAKEMFYHGYNNYMNNAYPADELMPLSCKGRFRDVEPNRGDIDDAMGNFSLTLIDSLDSLVVFNDVPEFERAVALVIRDVTFDSDIVVSVFETNIRVLGGLLSGHVLVKYIQDRYPDRFTWYREELLALAKDIGQRLLPAFNTSTGIPHPRINLRHGMKSPKIGIARDTCTACAGTMILEFGALSRLTGEPIFETAARRAMDYLWHQRHRSSDLVGTVLNIHSGDWVRRDSGVGAGIDSYYEYLLKAYILLGDDTYLTRFNKHYDGIMKYISQGPLLVDVHMHRPHTNAKGFMDALLAFWPGLQVLKGDIKPAIETHEMLYQVMERHNFLLPEAFSVTDFQVHWGQHLMRPEFIESTYFLYKATGDEHYLEVGKQVMHSLQKFARTKCGFAAVKDVRTGSQEDRMDSFVLAETFKYLFLLFSSKSDLIIDVDNFIFTTEAHLLPLSLAVHSSNRTGVERSEGSALKLTRKSPYLSFVDEDLTAGVSDDGEPTKLFQMCPNTRYLFPDYSRSGSNFGEIRASLKGYVNMNSRQSAQPSSSCASASVTKVKKRQLRISAEEFSASNQKHLDAVKRMGINVVILPDGRVQLVHSTTTASSMDEAEEGAIFMQDMIAISKQQLAKAEEQLRIVSFTSPKTGVKINLAAGPAQFGPDLNIIGTSISAQVVKVDPYNACNWPLAEDMLQSLRDKIGIVIRGDCMFIQKARHIQRVGGVGVIVVDNVAHTSSTGAPMFAMSGDGSTDVDIPVVFLYGQEGSTLLDILRQHPNLVVHLEPSNAFSIEEDERPKKAPPNVENIGVGKVTAAEPVLDTTHGSEDWKKTLSREEEEDEDAEPGSLPSILKGIAHITEITDSVEQLTGIKKPDVKLDLKGASLDGLEKVLNVMASGLSEKYREAMANDGKPKTGSFKVEKKLMEDVFNQVLQKSLETFREVIDEKKYRVLEPVLGSVIKSMKNLNEAQEKLDGWLNELRIDPIVTDGVSYNPLTSPQAFVRYVLTGNTEKMH